MAFPKVDGLTSKLKRRLLWGNLIAYLASMLFNFWGYGAAEDHWTHQSKVGREVAAANAGFFMLWWYGVWPGVIIPRLHWSAWKRAVQSWPWLLFIVFNFIFLGTMHMQLWAVEF